MHCLFHVLKKIGQPIGLFQKYVFCRVGLEVKYYVHDFKDDLHPRFGKCYLNTILFYLQEKMRVKCFHQLLFTNVFIADAQA